MEGGSGRGLVGIEWGGQRGGRRDGEERKVGRWRGGVARLVWCRCKSSNLMSGEGWWCVEAGWRD